MREPIGCDEATAQLYFGCSDNLWAEYKARKIVKCIRRGFYSYAMLNRAMEALETEREGKTAEIIDLKRHKQMKTPQEFKDAK